MTRWSKFDTSFEGVHWRELAKLAEPKPTARFAIAHAEAGFTSNVPLSFLEDESALLATHGDGEPLTPDHGYPLRLVIPGKYFWKSAKWLRGIELSSVDKPGFWERYGYSNDADPWREERYALLGRAKSPGRGIGLARSAVDTWATTLPSSPKSRPPAALLVWSVNDEGRPQGRPSSY